MREVEELIAWQDPGEEIQNAGEGIELGREGTLPQCHNSGMHCCGDGSLIYGASC